MFSFQLLSQEPFERASFSIELLPFVTLDPIAVSTEQLEGVDPLVTCAYPEIKQGVEAATLA